MSILELLLIAAGLSMDAFAIAVCCGLSAQKPCLKKALIAGLYFGFFQAAMPVIGYLIGAQFAEIIVDIDHWIAFMFLTFIGAKMIIGSFKENGCSDRACPEETCTDRGCPGGGRPDTEEVSLKPSKMLPLAIATSIDALAVGISFAFLKVRIIPAAAVIGVTALALSMAGVKIGSVFGGRFKAKAELAGGVMLVLMGVKILMEHTGIINF